MRTSTAHRSHGPRSPSSAIVVWPMPGSYVSYSWTSRHQTNRPEPQPSAALGERSASQRGASTMARIRRRALLQRTDYSVWHAAQLDSGHDYFGNAWGNDPDPARIAEAWEDLGEGLLEFHVSHFPGTRPWAWWVVVAPE